MADDIVYFLLPDGTKVSNDPRFDLAETLEEYEGSVEYSGDVGVPADEFQAQHQVEHLATMNSGQPGVGENPVPDPQDLIGPMGTDAMQRQQEDLAKAQEGGYDLTNPAITGPEPVDSNAAVQEVRQAKRDAQEELRKAQEKLGKDDVGDPDEPYSKWNQKQLRLEIARRNAERNENDQIDVSSAKKKSDLSQALDDDDARQGSGGTEADNGSNS